MKMACLINQIAIENVEGGIINFGNIFKVAPISIEDGIVGAGGSNSGDYINTHTKCSMVNVSRKSRSLTTNEDSVSEVADQE